MSLQPATAVASSVEAAAADSAVCLRCGACCFSRLETYVRVTGEDWARLGDDAERAAHFIGSRAYLKMRDGRCVSLAIRAATDGSGAPEYFCSIYERRPRVCRELGRGSPECEAERELKGGRPAEAAGDAVATEPRAA